MILQHVKTDCKNVGNRSTESIKMSNPMAALIAKAKEAKAKAEKTKATPTKVTTVKPEKAKPV
jgi:hypothetical protein